MNILRRDVSLKLVGILCVGTAMWGCQTSGSHFAEMSQQTMVLDTVGNGTGRTSPGQEGSGVPEGVGREGRNFYYIRNGQAIRLTQREHFAQGVSYEGRGRVILRNGSIVNLRDGEMVTFAGERLVVPPGTVFAEPTPRPQPGIVLGGR